MIRSAVVRALIVGTLACAGACRAGELHVATIQLGRSINPDKTIGTHTTRFKRDDTIYAAVLTTGSGSATIAARWIYAGQVVSEPTQKVSYRGDAATEFHIRNSGGFPAGNYKVEILLNGQPVGSREFRIER